MPTRPEAADTPAASARGEAARWADAADAVRSLGNIVPIPSEKEVVRYFDPALDLGKRAARWGNELPDHRLTTLARFAAGLAVAEAEAWEQGKADVAVRAYADRRHLAGDRLIHWAVPWLIAVAEAHPGVSQSAEGAAQILLEIGDSLRPAPTLSGTEGLYPPGEDAFGPLAIERPVGEYLYSLWSGVALVGSGSVQVTADAPEAARDWEALANGYRRASRIWDRFALRHPGTGALWRDLALRAAVFADVVDAHRKA